MAEIEDINGNGGQVKEFQVVGLGRFFRIGEHTYCKINEWNGFRVSNGATDEIAAAVQCIEFVAGTVALVTTYQGANAVPDGGAYTSGGHEYIMGSGDPRGALDITDIDNPVYLSERPDAGDVRPAVTTKLQFDQ